MSSPRKERVQQESETAKKDGKQREYGEDWAEELRGNLLEKIKNVNPPKVEGDTIKVYTNKLERDILTALAYAKDPISNYQDAQDGELTICPHCHRPYVKGVQESHGNVCWWVKTSSDD
jgi:hypothetical protein